MNFARALIAVSIAAGFALATAPVRAQSEPSGSFEAWGVPLPKPVRRAHGSSNPVYPAPLPKPDHFRPDRPITAEPQLRDVPPVFVSPDTGRALRNLPAIGAGPSGRETGQDRAMRCAHQAGVYGETGGSYLGACINQ